MIRVIEGHELPAIANPPSKGNIRDWLQMLVNLKVVGHRIDWETAGDPVLAWVLRGLWCADCPDCPENLPVTSNDPVFFCPNCFNAKNEGKARAVAFPPEKAVIEQVLNLRKIADTRNWLVSETVHELIAENAKHGELG